MTGVLASLKVLDLSSGIAGPMTAMLLGDNGASVTKIEPPGGDPARKQPGPHQLGYHVWQRGKRSAFLDLHNADDKKIFLALAQTADIVVESFAPGEAAKLGIDYATLSQLNPRIIVCSITGYGRDNEHAQRPAVDALVQARTGLMFEQRGWAEGALNHMNGEPDPFPDLEIPQDWVQGAPGLPWVLLMLNALPTVRIVPSSASTVSVTQPSSRNAGSASDSSTLRTGCIVISAVAAASIQSLTGNLATASARIGW